jgi:hypothetical protein
MQLNIIIYIEELRRHGNSANTAQFIEIYHFIQN